MLSIDGKKVRVHTDHDQGVRLAAVVCLDDYQPNIFCFHFENHTDEKAAIFIEEPTLELMLKVAEESKKAKYGVINLPE